MSSKTMTCAYTERSSDGLDRLGRWLDESDSIVIGAGAGLSTSAGMRYDGPRFEDNFGDFIAKYGYGDLYRASFQRYDSLEEHWAFWSRMIMLNRYEQEDNGTLYYTQGDYGLWQCSKPCHPSTYDNETAVRRMAEVQRDMKVPTELVPRCPICRRPMTMNLRVDDTFVQDFGWYEAAKRYNDFLDSHSKSRTLYLELGVGYNTPGIIKYPFWNQTIRNPRARYACINLSEAYFPEQLDGQAVGIDMDIGDALKALSRGS